jgi:heme/copper-type cytochrome/quinol oxidase subunit 1
MTQAIIASAIVAAAMAAILLGKSTTWHRHSVNIHIHDTYFVLPHWFLVIFILSLLTFVFGATAAYCHAFKKTGYNLLGIAGLLGMVGLWLYIRGVFKQ